MKIIKITNKLVIVINPETLKEIKLVIVNLEPEQFKKDNGTLEKLIKDDWKINDSYQFESGMMYELYKDVKIK